MDGNTRADHAALHGVIKRAFNVLENLEQLTLLDDNMHKKYESKRAKAFKAFNYYELKLKGKTFFVTMGVTVTGEEKLYCVKDKMEKS